jgi:hypothetical protein
MSPALITGFVPLRFGDTTRASAASEEESDLRFRAFPKILMHVVCSAETIIAS